MRQAAGCVLVGAALFLFWRHDLRTGHYRRSHYGRFVAPLLPWTAAFFLLWAAVLFIGAVRAAEP